ncbi:MAG: hypothetical protein ACKO5E_04570 [bacterium]
MRCEVKILISSDDWGKLQQRIPPDLAEKKRDVWFLETPEQSLKQHEVLLRVRVSRKKGVVESTTKWRRWVPPYDKVLENWSSIKGFKAEVDATDDASVPAWSITRDKLKADDFELVKIDPAKLARIFSTKQLLLIRAAWPGLALKKLKCWGPIESTRWQLEDGYFIERWTIQEKSVIEISRRGDEVKSTLKELRDWLKAVGINWQPIDGGKTAWALDQLIPRP